MFPTHNKLWKNRSNDVQIFLSGNQIMASLDLPFTGVIFLISFYCLQIFSNEFDEIHEYNISSQSCNNQISDMFLAQTNVCDV